MPFKNNEAKYGPVRQAANGNTIRRMRFACLITRLQTRSEYVIIIAFLRRQWLREHASLLRYT